MNERPRQDTPNGGHIALPKRIPLWPALVVLGAALSVAAGVGRWAYAHEHKHLTAEQRWAVVQKYMCMDCERDFGKSECTFVCAAKESDQ